MASQSVEGELRREWERYVNDEVEDRQAVTWDDLRKHLQKSFSSPFESECLRDETKQVKQTAYETTAAYCRKFRDAADLGYPAAGRNADQHRTLRRPT